MMGFPLKFWLAGVMLFALAACSSEADKNTDLSRMIAGELVNVAKAKRKGRPEQVNVSPEDFAKIKIPLIQVNLLERGGTDFMKRAVSRRDSFGGTVEVWQSQSKAQIFLRNGIVVGTRGIGDNIISADASYLVKALRAGKSSRGERQFTLSDGDLTVSKISLACQVEKVGRGDVVFANQKFATNRFVENCQGNHGATLKNEFWVDPRTGLVRKSKQWMGVDTGYFEIVLLRSNASP